MNIRTANTFVLAAAVALLSSGCAAMRVARTPLDTVVHEARAGEAAPTRAVILLPGFGDRPRHFERNGFVEAIREADPHALVIAADAHFGYYRTRTVVERLHDDVLVPAIESGADEIWVVGISMGGAGALSLAEAHGEHLDGVLLLAPYMGGRDIAIEVSDAGGLEAWDRYEVEGEGERAAFFRDIWVWLDGYTTDAERPELYMGVGTGDDAMNATDIVAEVLPEDHYFTRPGGHGWKVWRPVFRSFVDQRLASPVQANSAQ